MRNFPTTTYILATANANYLRLTAIILHLPRARQSHCTFVLKRLVNNIERAKSEKPGNKRIKEISIVMITILSIRV